MGDIVEIEPYIYQLSLSQHCPVLTRKTVPLSTGKGAVPRTKVVKSRSTVLTDPVS